MSDSFEQTRHVGLLVIGGGAAGLASALGALQAGMPASDILIVEREPALGGILKQCIHNGFGLHRFDEELTGPEYAQRDIDAVEAAGVPYLLDATVLSLSRERTATIVSTQEGLVSLQADAVVLAMGSRERTRGMLGIAGSRPSGIYTAGTAQAFVNLRGELPGKRIVMLGSGDIGLIMARRLTYEGCEVLCVLNRSSFSGGLKRNIVQCLDDYDIPLIFNRTITAVHGNARLTGVTVSHVDPATKRPIPGTEELVSCDTLLLSAGLMPENELTRAAGIELDDGTGGAVVDQTFQTGAPGIFSAGNVLHVHDLVDYVSEEGLEAGACAAGFVMGTRANASTFEQDAGSFMHVNGGAGVGAPVPQYIARGADGDVTIRFRVRGVYRDARLSVRVDGVEVACPKHRIMVPAEMESITLKGDVRQGASTIEICVEEKEDVR